MRRIVEWLLHLKGGQLEGAESWAPSFAAQYNNWVILALVLVFAALVSLTVISYLREGQTSRKVKLTIAGIRIAVIVLIFAILFQPALVLRYKKDHYSALVVLVDDSLSMSIADRYADPGLRQAVAQRAGVSVDELGRLSRLEVVRKILARPDSPLSALSADHPLVLLRFSTSQPGQEAYTRPLAEVNFVAASDKKTKALASPAVEEINKAFTQLAANGYETNLASALRDAADKLQGRRVSGIVLVSDGQVTSTGDTGNRLSAALAYLRQRSIPVFAVGVGDPQPPRNVVMHRLQGPTEVRKDSTIELTAYVSHRNCGGQNVHLVLKRQKAGEEGWSDVASQQVELKEPEQLPGRKEAPSEAQEVPLRVEAKQELGDFVYKAEIVPLEGEFSGDDNVASAKVRVSDENIKVLLISGDAGWEMQYLRNFLLRAPDRYAVSVWQQDAELAFNQEASTGMRLDKLPQAKPELYKYEVVVLYDPAHTQEGFDKNFVSMLDGFVSDHHGGLCYIASNKFTDRNLAVRDDTFACLVNLLPVEVARQGVNIADQISRGEPTPWPMLPTVTGLDHPVLRLGKDLEETQNIWKVLPGVFWAHPVVRLKPLASSLAISSDPISRTGDGSGEPAPMIAVQYYGKGRVLYMGTDETWRWRALGDGLFYRKYWSNVMDFLAAGRLEKKRILITSGADKFSLGEEMRVRVEAYDRNFEPDDSDSFQIEMVNAATLKTDKITLQRDEKKKIKGHYEGVVPLRSVGTFELTAKREEPEFKDDVAGKTVVVTLPEEEFRHPETDTATLETISPGGRYVSIVEADKLTKLVSPGKLTVHNDVPHELWDVPGTLAIIVLLLAAEWILRKRFNMT